MKCNFYDIYDTEINSYHEIKSMVLNTDFINLIYYYE